MISCNFLVLSTASTGKQIAKKQDSKIDIPTKDFIAVQSSKKKKTGKTKNKAVHFHENMLGIEVTQSMVKKRFSKIL